MTLSHIIDESVEEGHFEGNEQIMSRRVEARKRGRAAQEVTRGLIRATCL
jgi:hypothetical protein